MNDAKKDKRLEREQTGHVGVCRVGSKLVLLWERMGRSRGQNETVALRHWYDVFWFESLHLVKKWMLSPLSDYY